MAEVNATRPLVALSVQRVDLPAQPTARPPVERGAAGRARRAARLAWPVRPLALR